MLTQPSLIRVAAGLAGSGAVASNGLSANCRIYDPALASIVLGFGRGRGATSAAGSGAVSGVSTGVGVRLVRRSGDPVSVEGCSGAAPAAYFACMAALRAASSMRDPRP